MSAATTPLPAKYVSKRAGRSTTWLTPEQLDVVEQLAAKPRMSSAQLAAKLNRPHKLITDTLASLRPHGLVEFSIPGAGIVAEVAVFSLSNEGQRAYTEIQAALPAAKRAKPKAPPTSTEQYRLVLAGAVADPGHYVDHVEGESVPDWTARAIEHVLRHGGVIDEGKTRRRIDGPLALPA